MGIQEDINARIVTGVREARDRFMDKYYGVLHTACPKCGATSHSSPLVGFIFDRANPDAYVDDNIATCGSCGDKHKVHDRVEKKTFSRINLFGGPGAGKSTTAAWVFSMLKQKGKHAELVGEYVKSWAYSDRNVDEFDQVYLFGKQMQYEYRFLKSESVDLTVTDSPVFSTICYTRKFVSSRMADALQEISEDFDEKYPPINIYLDRGDKPYTAKGRYQTEAEARELDEYILSQVTGHYDNVHILPYSDSGKILQRVLDYI